MIIVRSLRNGMNKLLLFIMICMSQLLADLIHPQDESELNYIHMINKSNFFSILISILV